MSDGEALVAAIDAEPDNHFLREVFADFLDDIGDPRGPGYRALGVNGWHAVRCDCAAWEGVDGRKHPARTDYIFGHHDNTNFGKPPGGWPYYAALIPVSWWNLLVEEYDGERCKAWKFWKVRKRAEDAAALAFSRLPPDRQAELLKREAITA